MRLQSPSGDCAFLIHYLYGASPLTKKPAKTLCNLDRMGTGLLDEPLARQPVSAYASRRAHLQRMRTGPSSDGLERQQRMVTVFTSEPLPCNLERMGMGLLGEQLAGQPVSTHAWRQANLQRTTDGL